MPKYEFSSDEVFDYYTKLYKLAKKSGNELLVGLESKNVKYNFANLYSYENKLHIILNKSSNDLNHDFLHELIHVEFNLEKHVWAKVKKTSIHYKNLIDEIIFLLNNTLDHFRMFPIMDNNFNVKRKSSVLEMISLYNDEFNDFIILLNKGAKNPERFIRILFLLVNIKIAIPNSGVKMDITPDLDIFEKPLKYILDLLPRIEININSISSDYYENLIRYFQKTINDIFGINVLLKRFIEIHT